MKKITTNTNFSPPISQFFDRKLLENTCKFNDDETDLWRIWEYIERNVWKKLESTLGEKRKCEKLKQQFLELYESIKTQKENIQAKTKNKTESPFYHIEHPSTSDQKLFFRLKYKKS